MPELNEDGIYGAKTAEAVKKIHPSMQIHDFRFVAGATHTNLIFDVVVPFEVKMNETEVKAAVAEKAIRAVIEERMDLEQFSECDITMADLTKIRQALVNTLTGVYHHRIKYPNIKYKHTDKGTKGENV